MAIILDGKNLRDKILTELKEKIDAQIIVTKDKTGGSRVKLVK